MKISINPDGKLQNSRSIKCKQQVYNNAVIRPKYNAHVNALAGAATMLCQKHLFIILKSD